MFQLISKIEALLRPIQRDSESKILKALFEIIFNLCSSTYKFELLKSEIPAMLFEILRKNQSISIRNESLKSICNLTHGLEIISSEKNNENHSLLLQNTSMIISMIIKRWYSDTYANITIFLKKVFYFPCENFTHFLPFPINIFPRPKNIKNVFSLIEQTFFIRLT